MHIEDFRYKKSEYYRYTDLFRTVAYYQLVAMHTIEMNNIQI